MMENLVSRVAEYKAIQSIIREMEEEKLSPEGQVSIRIARLRFEKGRHFMDSIADIKVVVNPDEVEQ
jgi:hypothetical protein